MKWLLPLLILLGCYEPHYKWVQSGIPSSKVVWEVVDFETVKQKCGWQQYGFSKIVACATQIRENSTCYVFSYLTPEQAKVSWDLDGLSIYEHELRHCEGWRHQ